MALSFTSSSVNQSTTSPASPPFSSFFFAFFGLYPSGPTLQLLFDDSCFFCLRFLDLWTNTPRALTFHHEVVLAVGCALRGLRMASGGAR